MRTTLPHEAPSARPQNAPASRGVATKPCAPLGVHEVLATPGRPLAPEPRQRFESRFGHDFTQVRLHDDAQAAGSADRVGALAYAVGRHVVMGRTASEKTAAGDDRILAHELAHTLQQRNAGAPPRNLPIGEIDSPGERAARDATDAALSGGGRTPAALSGGAVLQRQPKPDATPDQTTDNDQSGKDAGASKDDDDEPTPWLTLQGQGFAQFSQVYTTPKPPPWLLGGQLGANIQFHAGKKGFELGLFGQYGRVMRWDSHVMAGGDQFQAVVQPSWVIVNSGKWQVAIFGQGSGGATTSTDPMVAGKQFSLTGGGQVTYEIFSHDRFKLQGAASAAGGAQWSRAPSDSSYSPSGTWQVSAGVQLSFDAVKRSKPAPPPPPENITVPIPDPEPAPKDPPKPKPDDPDSAKKAPDGPVKDSGDATKPAGQPPMPPPLPVDGRIFFLLDRPLPGAPAENNVLQSGLGDEVPATKQRVQSALAGDPKARVMFLGFASMDGPDAGYNCRLGLRRAQWLRTRMEAPAGQVALDAGAAAGACDTDQAGAVSFGSTRAADTKSEEERRLDRFGVVHFFRV